MKLKFKMGDRVVVQSHPNYSSEGKGPGAICGIDPHDDELPYCVAFDSGKDLWRAEEHMEPEAAPTKGVDPKAAYGSTKPSVALVPSVGLVLAALAAEDGGKKYGPYNYREGHPVEVMTYANACLRHLQAFIDGEDFTSDTGVPNLGGVIMCACIIADIMATGVALDNRPKVGPASKIQDAGKEWKKAVAAGEDPVAAALRILGPAMGVRT